MKDLTFSLSKEARQRRPYRSLYAAVLFQSFEDALNEAMATDTPADRDATKGVPPERHAAPAGQPALTQ